MAMAQGFSQEEVAQILADIDGSGLIDDKTKDILRFTEKITRHAYKVTKEDVEALKKGGCTEDEIYEAVSVASLFNYMDRMADALGVPAEGMQDMVAQMQANG